MPGKVESLYQIGKTAYKPQKLRGLEAVEFTTNNPRVCR
jgi:hypothetical protein